MAVTNAEEEKKYTTDYQSQYKDQIQGLYDQIANRKDFTYDVNADAMYQQLKDQYVQGGRMAMMDTMGQAQAMTGGYGNSYAQGVGQQAYQGYLKGLNDQVPNLYQMALNRYIQQGDQLTDRYSMLTAQEAQDYSRWAANRDFDYGKYVDDRNYQYQLDERDYGRQQDQQALALQQAQAMIAQGVRPSDEMLAQAGLSKEYLDAMLPENVGGGEGRDLIADWYRWLEKQNQGGGGNGGGGPNDDVFPQNYNGVYADANEMLANGKSYAEIANLVSTSSISQTEKDEILSDVRNQIGSKRNNRSGNGGR